MLQREYEFQSLTGRLKTLPVLVVSLSVRVFQSLTGRLKTDEYTHNNGMPQLVSIPHR